MEKKIEQYLDKITASIPNAEDAKMVRMEIEDHIMTKVEVMLLSGVDEDTAIQQVLISMGDEEELQKDLGVVHSEHKMRGKIIYESSKGQCQYLAERMGEELGIPYAAAKENPDVRNKELLIIVKKGVYGGGAVPELMKYIQHLSLKDVKMVVLIETCFYTGNRKIHSMNSQNWESGSNDYFYGGNKILKKILSDKGIQVMEERRCHRSFKLLGRIPKGDLLAEIKYIAKLLGIYI